MSWSNPVEWDDDALPVPLTTTVWCAELLRRAREFSLLAYEANHRRSARRTARRKRRITPRQQRRVLRSENRAALTEMRARAD